MPSTSVVIRTYPRPRPGSRVTNPPAQSSSQRHHAQCHHAQRPTPSPPLAPPTPSRNTPRRQNPRTNQRRTHRPIHPPHASARTDDGPRGSKSRDLQGQPTCRHPDRRTGEHGTTKGGQKAKSRESITQQFLRRREYMEDAPAATESKGERAGFQRVNDSLPSPPLP